MRRTTLRARTYELLEVGDTFTGRLINWLLMVVIVLNVTAVILESVAALYAKYAPWFQLLEAVSIALFSIEYVARLWAAAENADYSDGWLGRLRYAVTPMALVDLAASRTVSAQAEGIARRRPIDSR